MNIKQPEKNSSRSKLNKTMLTLAGHFFVGMGVIGAVLPVMPTTIFLILAAGCYAKSSPRFHAALMNNKFFGKHLKNYLDKKGTPISVKIVTIVFLWIGISASIYFADLQRWVVVMLLLIAVAVTWHVVSLKPYKE